MTLSWLTLHSIGCPESPPFDGAPLECANTVWVDSFDVTYVDLPQCGTTSLDTNGDGTPDVLTTSCDTPTGDTAPDVVSTATAPGGSAEASVSQMWTDSNGTAVTCRLTPPALGSAHCVAGMSRDVVLDLVPGTPAGTALAFFVVARTLATGPGAGDPFSATVTVQCPGQAAIAIPTTGDYVQITHVYDGSESEPIVCNVTGDITQSSTSSGGETIHKLSVGVYACPSDSCHTDWDCGVARHCVGFEPGRICQDGSAGASCDDPGDCSPSAPVCYSGARRCRALGGFGAACRVHRDCEPGLVCDPIPGSAEGSCAEPPSGFTLDQATITPDLNATGGLRPRFTPEIDLAIVGQTSAPMGILIATPVACDDTQVSSCAPVSSGPPVPPGATVWSVGLADYSSGTFGRAYSVDVSAEDELGTPAPINRQVDFEVYPPDPDWSVSCSKSYAPGTDELSVSFSIGLPPGVSPASVFNTSYLLYQRRDASGWTLDENDPTQGDFLLQNPKTMVPVDDGEYQLIFTGLVDFATPVQAALRFDTSGGGPLDSCTLVP